MARLSERAKMVRKAVMDQVLAQGTCPKTQEISDRLSIPRAELASIFKDLEAALCIAVQNETHVGLTHFQDEQLAEPLPELGEIFFARPFAAFKNHYEVWVDGEQKWWGECAVECCGISAMFPAREVIVRSVCRYSKEPVELVGRDGTLIDYSPKTLRVHFGFPVRFMPDDAIGWCDYNSYFISEEAVAEWRKTHPEVRGVTRDPVTVSRFVSIVGKGRLQYDYRFTVPVVRLLVQGKKYGLTRALPVVGVHVPDPFFMPTPRMVGQMRRKGYKNFVGFSLW
jgi:hypothetical protein